MKLMSVVKLQNNKEIPPKVLYNKVWSQAIGEQMKFEKFTEKNLLKGGKIFSEYNLNFSLYDT